MVDVILFVVDRILVVGGHNQRTCGTAEGAQATIAAQRHIYVINIGAHLDRRTIRCEYLRFILSTFFGFIGYALCRTDARTAAIANTILDLVEKL